MINWIWIPSHALLLFPCILCLLSYVPEFHLLGYLIFAKQKYPYLLDGGKSPRCWAVFTCSTLKGQWPPKNHTRRYSAYLQSCCSCFPFIWLISSRSLTEGMSRELDDLAEELLLVEVQHKWREGSCKSAKKNFLLAGSCILAGN